MNHSGAGAKAPINRTHSKRFALAAESADHASAFGVRASSAPISQGRLPFDGRAGSWKRRYPFFACIGTMNLAGSCRSGGATPKPGGSSGPPNQRASVLECGGAPPLSAREWTWNSCGSWKASSALRPCTGTMNPPLTPPRRGTDSPQTNVRSSPGRGRRWVG